jgi:peptidoglycan/LPS O-acetylase OafA/YrhL
LLTGRVAEGSEDRSPLLSDWLRGNVYQLNAIRLALALLVLVSHAWPIGGYGWDPRWPTFGGSTSLGTVAVGAFFAMSGILVTMSATRRRPFSFMWARFIRIVPAYLVVLVAAAVVLGPIVWSQDHGSLSGYLEPGAGGPVHYVLHNIVFPIHMQFGINDIFVTTTPLGVLTGESGINGSLWTLPYEVRCYALVFAVVYLLRSLRSRLVVVTGLLVTAAVLILFEVGDPWADTSILRDIYAFDGLFLLFAFLCGALLGLLADHIRFTPRLWAPAVLAFAVATLMGGNIFLTVGLGSLAIILPLVAGLLPRRGLRVFRHDLSYGTYIYAFPVQMTLAWAGWNSGSVWFFIAAAIPITLALAAVSWFALEHPALDLKDRFRSRTTD